MGLAEFWRGGWINRLLVLIGGAMAAFICGGVVFYPEVSSWLGISTRSSRSTTVATLPPANIGPQGDLPGLNAAMLAEEYAQKDFTCSQPEQSGGVYKRVCVREIENDVRFQLEIYGREEISVDRLVAIAFQTDEKYDFLVATRFLEEVALIEYTGSASDQGKTWVRGQLSIMPRVGSEFETLIGGIQFRMYGPSTERTLEMMKPTASS